MYRILLGIYEFFYSLETSLDPWPGVEISCLAIDNKHCILRDEFTVYKYGK